MDSGWIVYWIVWLCGAGFALSLMVHLILRERTARSVLLSALAVSVGATLGMFGFLAMLPAGQTGWPLSEVALFCAYLAPVGFAAATLGAVPGALVGQVIRLFFPR